MSTAEFPEDYESTDGTDRAAMGEQLAASNEPGPDVLDGDAAAVEEKQPLIFADNKLTRTFYERVQNAYGKKVLNSPVSSAETRWLIGIYNTAHKKPLAKPLSTWILTLALQGYTSAEISKMVGCGPSAASHLMLKSAPITIARGLRETLDGDGIVEVKLVEPEDPAKLGTDSQIGHVLQKRARSRPVVPPAILQKPPRPERAIGPIRSRVEIARDIAELCDFNEEERSDFDRFINPHAAVYDTEPSPLSAINKIINRLEARPAGLGVWHQGLDLRAYERIRLDKLLGKVVGRWRGVPVPPLSLNQQQQKSRLNGLPPVDDTKYLYSGLEQIIDNLKQEHPADA